MDAKQRTDLLKDEYVMLQGFYQDIDEKGLNIKNWSITVALAAIGAGFFYHRNIFLLSFVTAVMFWVLEAYWRGLSYFFVVRIRDIDGSIIDSVRRRGRIDWIVRSRGLSRGHKGCTDLY